MQTFYSKVMKTRHISNYFGFNPLLISIFSAVVKENATWRVNFSGLILPGKNWADLFENMTIFGSCRRGLRDRADLDLPVEKLDIFEVAKEKNFFISSPSNIR